jgi:hypothetical protein
MSEENSNTLPVRVHDDTAMANIVAALRSDGMRELMKFDKGDYKKRGGVIVPLETRFVAHVTEMQHGYVRFNDEQELVERHVARMATNCLTEVSCPIQNWRGPNTIPTCSSITYRWKRSRPMTW